MKNKTIKNKIGLLKYKLLDCWPYYFQNKKALQLRENFKSKLKYIPEIILKEPPHIEIHMLCGKKHVDMGIWSTWSIMRYFENSHLYIHSDGTLDDEDILLWKKIIPSLTIVHKSEAGIKAKDYIQSAFPFLYNWRNTDWCGSYLVDFHLFGKTDFIITMDADVLCFQNPLKLKEMISNHICCWNRDINTAYSASAIIINNILSIKVPNNFNAGFTLMRRMNETDFSFINDAIEKLHNSQIVDINHLWSSQTYLAISATNFNGVISELPQNYNIYKGKTDKSSVLRHYVGIPSIRPRYFLEGIPRLLCDINIPCN